MTLLANDAYGNTVDFTTDGVTDSYLIGDSVTHAFPAGTSLGPVYLTIAIKTNIARAQPALQDFVDQHYDARTRLALNALLYCAQANGLLPNRVAYLMQVMTWVQAVIAYSAAYVATVSAMTNPATVAATQPDFTQIAADPLVTPIAAVQINS